MGSTLARGPSHGIHWLGALNALYLTASMDLEITFEDPPGSSVTP